MTKQYSIAEGRANLAKILHDVEGSANVALTRRGKPVAIVLSLDQYTQLENGRGGLCEA